jgi:hypothetical protein
MSVFFRPKSKHWIVGEFNEQASQYQAPLNDEGRQLTGSDVMFAKTADGIDPRITYAYKHKRSAVHRARVMELG